MTDEPDELWITTEWIDGAYRPVLTLTNDLSFTLTKTRATAYAQAAIAAACDAEYDAGVMKQLTQRLSLDDSAAGAMIMSLRRNRPTREAAGVTFTGGVSAFDKSPFVSLHHGAQALGQMTPAQARRHAIHALEGWTGGELDTAYANALKETGLDEERIGQVVHAAGEFREPWAVEQ
jgi:hypothetical protein